MDLDKYFTNGWQARQVYMTIFAVLFCAIILKPIYEYVLQTVQLYLSHRKIVSSKGHWFWGHARIFGPHERGLRERWKMMKKFPKVHLTKVGPSYRSVSCYGPSLVSSVLNNANIPKNKIIRKFFGPWIGDGLLLASGKKWKRNRKLLTPAFHFEILKNYVKVFNESAEIMESRLRKSEDAIDVVEPVSMLALDNMLRCMMSYKSDCQTLGQAHPYVKALYEIATSVVDRFYLQPLSNSDFLFSLTAAGRKFNAAIKVTNQQTTTVIQERIKSLKNEENNETKNKKKKDFLDILILARDADGNGLSEKEIQDEVDTFLFEGHDTTASGIGWILYDLATHPEHQKKCREEVKEILGDRDYVAWEDLSKFNNLTMCIKESMRIHPPVPFCVSRGIDAPLKFDKDFGKDQLNITTNTTEDCSHVFPKGTMFELCVGMIHHNPHVWKDPETFDPSRFTPENFSKLPHFAYIPFSAGPRNCIGQNFAMMEIKITLAKCLKHFEIYVDETCPKPSLALSLVLRSSTGLKLRFKKLTGSE